jgi:hypothetical protein
MSIDKFNIELQLATLEDIMHELEKRDYKFIFSGYHNGKFMFWCGTQDFLVPILLANRLIKLCFNQLRNQNMDKRLLEMLQGILLIMDVLFRDVRV